MNPHDLIVIGAGPGGYVAAIRAAQLGLNVACVEQEPLLGGTCLRIGCIPSKALLESSEQFAVAQHSLAEHGVKVGSVDLDLPAMLKRKEQIVAGLTKGVEALFKKNKITRYTGHARVAGPGRVEVQGPDGTMELAAKHILLATGSRSATLPGVELDYDRIGTSTEALAYPDVPRHLVVIGAGYIGLELGAVWQRLGTKVTVLEYLDRILPGTDGEIAAEALKLFKRQGLEFRLGARVTGARTAPRDQGIKGSRDQGAGAVGSADQGGGGAAAAEQAHADSGEQGADGPCIVELEGAEPIRCDRVLLSVGRVPNTENLGVDTVGLRFDDRGHITVNDRFETSAPGVYAIGDAIRGPMLAHKASEEGIACVEHMVTGYGHVNYDAIPGVCYTQPEVAGVGRTEEELQAAGTEYRKGVIQFRASGRARALGQVDGRVKVLADAKTDRILGVHIIGPRAGDLIAEAATAIAFGASSEDLARCCHAHPTLAETLKEAALAVDGRAIHA